MINLKPWKPRGKKESNILEVLAMRVSINHFNLCKIIKKSDFFLLVKKLNLLPTLFVYVFAMKSEISNR